MPIAANTVIGIPTVGAIILGVFQLIHRNDKVGENYRKLLTQIIHLKSLETKNLLSNWDWKRDSTQEEGIPDEYINYWSRLGEFQDMEIPIRLTYFIYKLLRGLVALLIVLSVVFSVLAYLLSSFRSTAIILAYISAILSFILTILVFVCANKIESFLNLHLFQGRNL